MIFKVFVTFLKSILAKSQALFLSSLFKAAKSPLRQLTKQRNWV